MKRPSQHFIAVSLIILAGGDTLVRDVFALGLLAFGLHVHVPNCYVGSGPGC